MEKTVKHRFLNNAVFTALILPLVFFVLRDTLAVLTAPMFLSLCGKDSFLYQINDDIARLLITAVLMLVMPLYFRGKCNFGFRGGNPKLGLWLALPMLLVPVWNLIQIKVYHAPLVTGTAAVLAAVVHGIGPGVSEEVLCRSVAVSNLMRIWKDKPSRIVRSMLLSGAAFGLLHAVNAIATGDVLAALVQVGYTTGIGMLNGAIFLRSRNLWGVVLLHTLTDISAFLAVFDNNVTGMDIAFLVFGTLLFVSLAFYLIRPAKRAEIDALWADGWSFGDEREKRHIGIKVTSIISGVLAVAFVASLGVTVYQSKMGYDVSVFPPSEKALDKNVQYQISADGRELTVSLPYITGENYNLENPAPEALVLREKSRVESTFCFLFSHEGADTQPVRLVFSLMLGDSAVSIHDYQVTVSFNGDGTIASVGG